MVHAPTYRPFGAFRFLLASMVLLQHGLMLLPGGPGREMFYDLELGAVAVAVFFALSGFIVAEALSSFYAGRPAAFLANRCLRVVPPYLAALVLAFAVNGLLYAAGRRIALDTPLIGAPWQPQVLLAAMLEFLPGLPAHRISGQDFSFIPFAWTLRVEFAFYLAAFVTSWLMVGRDAAGQRRVGTAAFLAGTAAFGLFLALRHAGGGRQLLNVPFFAFGVCVFLARQDRGHATRLRLLLVTCCVPLAFVLCGERGHPVLMAQLPLLCLLFAALFALSRAPAPQAAWLRWDRRLGELSYPLYISHGIVLVLLCGISTRRGALPYLSAMIGALVLAGVLHRFIEAPLKQTRTRLRGAVV